MADIVVGAFAGEIAKSTVANTANQSGSGSEELTAQQIQVHTAYEKDPGLGQRQFQAIAANGLCCLCCCPCYIVAKLAGAKFLEIPKPPSNAPTEQEMDRT